MHCVRTAQSFPCGGKYNYHCALVGSRLITINFEVKVKVKCTVVQALKLCTGRTAHRGSRGIGKGKVHRCTGTEALYRPYGP